MGVSHVRNMDLPRMFGQTPWPWRAFIIRAIRFDGQMEGHWIGENEGEFDAMKLTMDIYELTAIPQVGGNQNAREFLDSQSDYDDSMSIQQKYNTKAAALYRDKISTLAQGKQWSADSSPAQNYASSSIGSSQHSSSRATSSSKSYQDLGGAGYQDNGGGYQNLNTQEFRDQKDTFFNRIQEENNSRPEWVNAEFAEFSNPVISFRFVSISVICRPVKVENTLALATQKTRSRRANLKNSSTQLFPRWPV